LTSVRIGPAFAQLSVFGRFRDRFQDKKKFFFAKSTFFHAVQREKKYFFHAEITFFHARATFFHAGEKAGFGYSAAEGSLINLLRTLYGQG
jgi:hypothetical protein